VGGTRASLSAGEARPETVETITAQLVKVARDFRGHPQIVGTNSVQRLERRGGSGERARAGYGSAKTTSESVATAAMYCLPFLPRYVIGFAFT